MAIDIITGKVFQPKFEGQRTAVDLEAIMDAEGLSAEEAVAQVLEERHAGTYYTATVADVQAEYDRLHEEALKDDPDAERRVVTPEEAVQVEQRIPNLAAQTMGQLAGGGTNPFLRTEAGLEAWVPIDAQGNPLDYGVPIDSAYTASHVFSGGDDFDAGGFSGGDDFDAGGFSGGGGLVAVGANDTRDAKSIIEDALRNYGLEGLLDDTTLDLVGIWRRTDDLETVWAAVRRSDPYKTRFPGMQQLADLGRAVSEETYVALERSYAQTLHQYGMPASFYDDPSDFGDLIAGDVSVAEFTNRVALASEAAQATTGEVRDQLSAYYGINEGDITAYYLDPERATSIFEERERLGAARIGGIAAETGFGTIGRQTAERLRAAGVTETKARQGFQEIAQSTIAEESVGDIGDITRTQLVGAEFGTDPEAARRIEKRRQTRLSKFAQSGGPALTQGGYIGLGSAK